MLRWAPWVLALSAMSPDSQPDHKNTYCNPMNIAYAYSPHPGGWGVDPAQGLRHRATADPVIVLFHGDYFLFCTNQIGYYWSPDMRLWNFVPRAFLNPGDKGDDSVAPAAFIMDDTLYFTSSDADGSHPIWRSRDPKQNDWEMVVRESGIPGIDPAWLLDDDGRLYVYHGSSNSSPIYGNEVDPKTWKVKSGPVPLVGLHPDRHGWERFGEGNDNTFLPPFIEGAWMTKHKGKYYLQYGGPGTEASGYGDGVYVGDKPLGPFTYQSHNPFSYKIGGFARGAGHGATFQDAAGRWWHTSTIFLSVKETFERRIGLWPAGFDPDGVLYCDQAYGDYPTRVDGSFAGWMLLNRAKPVRSSSTLGAYTANLAVDEDIRTYWSAVTGAPGEWFESDLGEVSAIHALQTNFADQDAGFVGNPPGRFHQYVIEVSKDGKRWEQAVDKSRNQTDVPHDYVELERPIHGRFVRIRILHMPTGKFALSGFRVFGRGQGARPGKVVGFVPLRAGVPKPGDKGPFGDRRGVFLKWQPVDDATGYVIRWGVSPDKLYSAVLVYGANDTTLRALDIESAYYFTVEAFNENGVGDRIETVHCP